MFLNFFIWIQFLKNFNPSRIKEAGLEHVIDFFIEDKDKI